MKLKVLEDNNTFINMYYLAEPGVSYYIEDGNDKILFDTGYSSVIIKNAKKMNIDLNEVNKLVISHGHDDHTGGLKYLFEEAKNIELIAHPECFNYKENESGLYIGSPFDKEKLSQVCKLNLSKEPIKVSEHIIYLGEIPVLNNFEPRYSIGKSVIDDKKIDDTMNDDSAIVYQSDKGLFIITGCSHSGICNIVEYAKKVCNDERIYGIIGGFHLFDINERLVKTIQYLKENNIKLLYPCHCVSLKAKIEMAKELGELKLGGKCVPIPLEDKGTPKDYIELEEKILLMDRERTRMIRESSRNARLGLPCGSSLVESSVIMRQGLTKTNYGIEKLERLFEKNSMVDYFTNDNISQCDPGTVETNLKTRTRKLR